VNGGTHSQVADRTVNDLLKDRFTATKNIDAMVKHFQEAVDEYHQGAWEKSLAKAAKFLEAAFKVLLAEANLPVSSGRQFKVDSAINGLAGDGTKGVVDDTIRLTIPRSLRFVYDVTSNRGGRHDPDEIDANEMDATAVIGSCSWVLAEMVRYSQKAGDLLQAKAVVEVLMERQYPFFEDIDGRVYFNVKAAKSARDLGLLLLWQRKRKRISRNDLTASIKRQRKKVTMANAKVAVQRLTDVVDDDGAGNLLLRVAGIEEAEKLLAKERRDRRSAPSRQR
jgi:predicted nucleic acid-binding protein